MLSFCDPTVKVAWPSFKMFHFLMFVGVYICITMSVLLYLNTLGGTKRLHFLSSIRFPPTISHFTLFFFLSCLHVASQSSGLLRWRMATQSTAHPKYKTVEVPRLINFSKSNSQTVQHGWKVSNYPCKENLALRCTLAIQTQTGTRQTDRQVHLACDVVVSD